MLCQGIVSGKEATGAVALNSTIWTNGNERWTNERKIKNEFTYFQVWRTAVKTNHSKYLAVRGIPNDSLLPLDRNIAIYMELVLYGNAAGTQGEVKINATTSVLRTLINTP